ncbi:MAG: type II secretion system protein [Gemmatimonadaceae bacterium]
MTHLRGRDGFALPTAILVIGILSISIAAGFTLVNSERRGVDDQKAQVSAFVLAEQGLQTFFVKRDSLGFITIPPGAKEGPVRIYLKGGYADVQLDRIRPPTGSLAGLYVVRSRGTQTQGAIGGTPAGVRTVAQYAAWEPAAMEVLAGWTAISGIQKNGSSGSFLGIDACRDSASIAGVAVPVVPGFNRPQTADSTEYLGQKVNDAARAVEIDWAGIRAGTQLTPNFVIPPDAVPSFADTTFYPVIYMKGNGTVGTSVLNNGRGILIVENNLDTGSGATFNWKGIVLVGGDLTGNGNNYIQGAIVSALNAKLGQNVPINTVNGTKQYQYNSCEVAKALMGLGALVPLPNTWVDNWVEY